MRREDKQHAATLKKIEESGGTLVLCIDCDGTGNDGSNGDYSCSTCGTQGFVPAGTFDHR